MVERLSRTFSDGELVAIRDHGREALLYDHRRTSVLEGKLQRYGIHRNGRTSFEEVIWVGDDLEGWLEEHRDGLDWVHHEWR